VSHIAGEGDAYLIGVEFHVEVEGGVEDDLGGGERME